MNQNEPIHSGFLLILDFSFGIPRIQNGEMVPCSNILNRNSGRNYEPDFVCVKGTPERIHEPGFGWKVIRERRKRK
ncbi:unnamed protein product [Rhizophagus irregularis]|nr:unnamed protein product [Rhizophagus irregularis]CAB5352677.1 unnamed protein product [Rhizophagus irregularis]